MSETSASPSVLPPSEPDALPFPDRRAARRWIDPPRRTVLILLLVFAAIELVGLLSIPAQASLTAVAAFICVNLAISGYRTNRTAGVVMAAVFTTRLVTLTLPATEISTPTRAGIVAFAMIAISYGATWVLSWDLNAGRMDEGFVLRKAWINKTVTSIVTVVSGIPLGIATYFALRPDEMLMQPLLGTTAVAWIVAFTLLGFAALGEELIYRRLVSAMVQHTGRSQASWPSALLYGSAFIGTQNPFMVLVAFVAGYIWSWCCERTGTVESVVASHAIATIVALVILPAIF